MLIVNLFDSNFSHTTCSVHNQTPRLVEYVRNQSEWDGITLFTDQWITNGIVDVVKSRYKIGWLHEGKALKPEVYAATKEVRHKFDFILTYDQELLAFDPQKYRFCVHGGSWIAPDAVRIYPKAYDVSLILSDKTLLPGHKLRHAIADMVPHIDIFGPRGNLIGSDKLQALQDYRFSIVIEACKETNFFTEHLLDCFATGTVPVYWGCPNIDEFFEMDGILYFENIKQLRELLPLLNEQSYLEMRSSRPSPIQENLERAVGYAITDDWIARNVLNPLIGGVL